MSAADVLAVATPSWKTKGLRSAKDLLASVAICSDDFVLVVVVVDWAVEDSDFEAVCLAALLVVVLVLRRTRTGERSQVIDDDLLDINRRDSMDVDSMLFLNVTAEALGRL